MVKPCTPSSYIRFFSHVTQFDYSKCSTQNMSGAKLHQQGQLVDQWYFLGSSMESFQPFAKYPPYNKSRSLSSNDQIYRSHLGRYSKNIAFQASSQIQLCFKVTIVSNSQKTPGLKIHQTENSCFDILTGDTVAFQTLRNLRNRLFLQVKTVKVLQVKHLLQG